MRTADPTAVLVPHRVLRRVIRHEGRLGWLGRVRVPHYLISGEDLAAAVDGTELDRATDEPWPDTVLLLAQPEPHELRRLPDKVLLTRCWRGLFRGSIERALATPVREGQVSATDLAGFLAGGDPCVLEEARSVLRKEGLLLPLATEQDVHRVFVAVFLELFHFDPEAIHAFFPAIANPEALARTLEPALRAEGLLARTRPSGAPDPRPAQAVRLADPEPPSEPGPPGEPFPVSGPTRDQGARLAAGARSATERGNSVRAAILWTRLAHQKGAGDERIPRAAARAAIRDLAIRLRKALFVQKGEAPLWVNALLPLLDRAASEFWSPERQLLHDLQNVCLDHEREVYRLDLLGWITSLGRRPLRRPLPYLREVTKARHLGHAAQRLGRVRLSREARAHLELLLQAAVGNAQKALRDRFRPWLTQTLQAIWVPPTNLPERVAFRKLVEELLDPIESRGFTTLSDLRDAASRDDLKLADLSGPAEFFHGDRLLQADRALAGQIEGVHRRGEVYLRWLQRASSLAFGTRLGRFVTRFLALPFGGAFVLLKGSEEINDVMIAPFTNFHIHFVTVGNVAGLGLVALALINHARLRGVLRAAVGMMGRVLRTALLELPARILNAPLLRRILSSATAIQAWKLLLKPGLLAALVLVLARMIGVAPRGAGTLGLVGYASGLFLFNTRTGERLEEVVIEDFSHGFRTVVLDVIPGLFHIIMAAFDRARESVEKLIYAGDEWLRFREGQSRTMLAVKAVLGLVWTVLAYVVRVYLNLLVEPQINPIKHFPVVTVAAKIMLPFAIPLTRLFALVLSPFLGTWIGGATAALTVFFLPGVFGFLVWELRSNWRLYSANRPVTLHPVVVGSHGETVVRLLRPGFHSGTVPRLFGRLRRSFRHGREGRAVHIRQALHHVEESIHRLVDRELVALLEESRAFHDHAAATGTIELATNRIRFGLARAPHGPSGLGINLEEHQGALVAKVFPSGWFNALGPERKRTLETALTGFLKKCGVDRILPEEEDAGSAFHANDFDELTRTARAPSAFSQRAIPWREWVSVWEAEATPGPSSVAPEWVVEIPCAAPRSRGAI